MPMAAEVSIPALDNTLIFQFYLYQGPVSQLATFPLAMKTFTWLYWKPLPSDYTLHWQMATVALMEAITGNWGKHYIATAIFAPWTFSTVTKEWFKALYDAVDV